MGAGSIDLDIGWPAFLEIYRELVEMNTARSGNCTRAAEVVATRLKAAGFADEDIVLVIPDAFPKEGSVIARLRGTEVATKPILLLAHLDVVEARREDWERDPFKLVEENGIFYGRGTFDDKAMAAVFVDSFIRFRQAGFRAQRELKLMLTCGEETPQIFNGVQYLLKQHRDLIDAAFALNEGADSMLDAEGKPLFLAIQTGEKSSQNFVLETRSSGGHSKLPGKNNALTRLAAGLVRLDTYEFPFDVNDATRRTFGTLARVYRGQLATDLQAIATGAATEAALQRVAAASREWNALMRTTCVATTAEAGHAPNALPQRAVANVNCRLLPGATVESVRDALVRAVADEEITVTKVGRGRANISSTAAFAVNTRPDRASRSARLAGRADRSQDGSGRYRRPISQCRRHTDLWVACDVRWPRDQRLSRTERTCARALPTRGSRLLARGCEAVCRR